MSDEGTPRGAVSEVGVSDPGVPGRSGLAAEPSRQSWEALESVLDTFEQRRAQDSEDRRRAEAEETEFRCGCTAVLTDYVIPTFESAGRSLARRAHECAVTKRISEYDVPSADLTVRPYVPNERWVRRSRLSMRCISTEGFVVYGEICPPRKDPISMSVTYPLKEITEGWIKKQVIQFVRAVLNEY